MHDGGVGTQTDTTILALRFQIKNNYWRLNLIHKVTILGYLFRLQLISKTTLLSIEHRQRISFIAIQIFFISVAFLNVFIFIVCTVVYIFNRPSALEVVLTAWISLTLSLSIRPYHPLLLAGSLNDVLYPHRSVVNKFLLVSQHWHIDVLGR